MNINNQQFINYEVLIILIAKKSMRILINLLPISFCLY